MEDKIIEAIEKLFENEWKDLELGSSQADLVEAHVKKTIKDTMREENVRAILKSMDNCDYKHEFTMTVAIDHDNLGKFATHHEENWVKDIPSHEELTSSIMDEVISWLNDLRFDVVIDDNND